MKKIVENFSFKRYLLLAIVFFIVSLIISLIIDGTKSINIINTLIKSLIFSFIMSLFARFNKKIKTQSNQSDEKL
jgi:phosphoglycerol transferase MdoB-like AlkP superfamily enzyme